VRKSRHGKIQFGAPLFLVLLSLCLTSCDRAVPGRIQGYVEGEFVHVASALPGSLKSLLVARGAPVNSGDPLFQLDDVPETSALQEAERRLAQARSALEDSRKGRRPSEIQSLEAQLSQARTALEFSAKELARQTKLAGTGAVAIQEFDRVSALRDQDQRRVEQLEAELITAQLGARPDQIAAAEANVGAVEAALSLARWNLAQKSQSSPANGVVFDTLYEVGEWVPSGRPVVVLLPPGNVKVRAFVPQTRLGSIRQGARAEVWVDNVAQPFVGSVSFISPRAEFTPPVIYSQEHRSKLVFMVEIRFESASAAQLHPGQPVDVELAAAPQ
jgi:HlyD family secretion protein